MKNYSISFLPEAARADTCSPAWPSRKSCRPIALACGSPSPAPASRWNADTLSPRPVSTMCRCPAGRCRERRARRFRSSWKTWPATLPPAGCWMKNTWPALSDLGGYASVPMGRAAARRRLPLVCWNRTSCLGRANRWLSRFASLVCTSFQPTEQHDPLRVSRPLDRQPDPQRSTRIDLRVRRRSRRTRRFTLRSSRPPRLIVLGGSGGARSLERERAAGLVQDPPSAGRLADPAPVGRGRRGSDAGTLSQVRPGRPRRGLLDRLAAACSPAAAWPSAARAARRWPSWRWRERPPCCCPIRMPPTIISGRMPTSSSRRGPPSCSTSAR